MAKLSCDINTNEVKLVSNYDSEEQCTSNVSDIEHSDDTVARNRVIQQKSENRDISDSILNPTMYLMPYNTSN
jgi:hypothetical protein